MWTQMKASDKIMEKQCLCIKINAINQEKFNTSLDIVTKHFLFSLKYIMSHPKIQASDWHKKPLLYGSLQA